MAHRFYAPQLAPGDQTVALDDDEASHLVRVLRLEQGSDVRVFNGRGLEVAARVELADKRGVVLRVLSPVESAPELPFELVLAQAVLKGDAMESVVRDAVMLGVVTVIPLITGRTEVSEAQLARGHRLERWHRIAVSSAKQCGRAVVPAIEAPRDLDAVLASERPVVVLAEPGAAGSAPFDTVRPLAASGRVVVAVGPEGGWAPSEVASAKRAGASLLTFGGVTFRADAAATVSIPVLRFLWGAL